MTGLFAGIDVQAAQACPYAMPNITAPGIVETGWIAAVAPPSPISGAIPEVMNRPIEAR